MGASVDVPRAEALHDSVPSGLIDRGSNGPTLAKVGPCRQEASGGKWWDLRCAGRAFVRRDPCSALPALATANDPAARRGPSVNHAELLVAAPVAAKTNGVGGDGLAASGIGILRPCRGLGPHQSPVVRLVSCFHSARCRRQSSINAIGCRSRRTIGSRRSSVRGRNSSVLLDVRC